ncbi:hypothetical protein DCD74_04415 [Lysobacter oculi]|uniref:Uncharacterized protein n=1 Tax=Solilutibacter oculi TaxID=2698682 RepID=A0A344J4T1_9GAMM|nr:hypothetical protein DCD74_04415 [Lysobacter oculi]
MGKPKPADAAPEADSASETSSTSAPAVRSEYSSLAAADCTLQKRDAESGSTVYRCPGMDSFTLQMHDSDARMSLDVVAGDGKPQPLTFWSLANGAFSNLGPKAEWRYAPEAVSPQALVVRYEAYEQPEKPDLTTSYLLVVKLAQSGSCLIGQVPPSPAQNEQARALADVAAERPCLGKE